MQQSILAGLKQCGKFAFALLAIIAICHPALADTTLTPVIDKADTVWVMISAALVIMMTCPGLAMFYSGLVRKNNMLSITMQVMAAASLVCLLWVICGYSLVFTSGPDGLNHLIGGFSKSFLRTVTPTSIHGKDTIPETVFCLFQMSFAIITPALIVGAFADRMKFSAVLLFMAFWAVLVYFPIAHQVWGGGNLADLGVLDYAGGAVVHVNAGMAGLVAALMLGPRVGYRPDIHNPDFAAYNLLIMLLGVGLLWFGWFGFNAGSALGATTTAGMAMLVTQIAAAAAAFAWMTVEWVAKGKPSATGFACGVVSGLVAITPAAGYVSPMGSIAVGAIAAVVCYFGSNHLKHIVGYDDSLDVVGVHGIGGFVGAILTGVFAEKAIGGTAGAIEGNWHQVWVQILGLLQTLAWSGVGSFIILKAVDMTLGLRVPKEVEEQGLDEYLHGERVL